MTHIMCKNVDTSSPEVLVSNAKHEVEAALSALDVPADGYFSSARVAYHVERLKDIIDDLEESLARLYGDGDVVRAFKRGAQFRQVTNAPLPTNGEILEKLEQ